MDDSNKTKFESYLIAEYEKKAEEHFFTMSDGSQLRILRSYANEDTHNGFTLFLVPGWGSVVLGWDDVLLEAMKDFDIVYVETREKKSSILAKGSKHDLDRFSSDIQEILNYVNIEHKQLILLGSSFGCLHLADGFNKNKFDSPNNIFVAPAIQIDLPPGLRYIVPLFPAWIMYPFKPLIRWWLKRSKSESPEQAAKYIRVMNEAQPKKWKKVSKHFLYWQWWEIYDQVTNELLLVAAEEDKMHAAEITQKLKKMMKNSIYVDLKTNKNTHTKPLVDLIRKHIK